MLLARAPPFGCFFRSALLFVFCLLPFGGGITGVGSPAPYGWPIYCLSSCLVLIVFSIMRPNRPHRSLGETTGDIVFEGGGRGGHTDKSLQ
ncbi:hypothetical protein B0H14DRAFT_2945181 [Mycena olivaceomarginata]|nr:hypothetical protein B0H14DRAFT_2945181 [Mycena olivaceomarginata]